MRKAIIFDCLLKQFMLVMIVVSMAAVMLSQILTNSLPPIFLVILLPIIHYAKKYSEQLKKILEKGVK